jgi:hypothetical protein
MTWASGWWPVSGWSQSRQKARTGHSPRPDFWEGLAPKMGGSWVPESSWLALLLPVSVALSGQNAWGFVLFLLQPLLLSLGSLEPTPEGPVLGRLRSQGTLTRQKLAHPQQSSPSSRPNHTHLLFPDQPRRPCWLSCRRPTSLQGFHSVT